MKKKKKVVLVHNWKDAWKWASIRTSVLGIILMGAMEGIYHGWILLPPQVLERIPNASAIALCLYVVILFGRICTTVQETHHGDKQ